jgi:hypothetical protein
MQNYLTSDAIGKASIRSSGPADPVQQIREIIAAALSGGAVPELKRIELFYIRQVNGEVNGQGVIYHFTPDFVYLVDIGYPRYPLIALPYEVPTVRASGGEYETIGRGDAGFPDFKEARLFSAAGSARDQILFPAQVKSLLIGVKEGVTEEEARSALDPYVSRLEKQGNLYVAEVSAFREAEIAAKIEREVKIVRYAELNRILRDVSDPWFVDRVL